MFVPRTLLFIALWLLLTQAAAQNPVQLRLGYFGSTITTPGVRLSADYSLIEHNRLIVRDTDTLTKTHQWLLSGSAGFYSRGSLQRGLFLLPQTGYQHVGKRGFTKTFLVGLGLLRLSTPRTRYTDAKGNAYRVEVPGESVLMKSLEVGLGWAYRTKQSWVWGWSLRPSAFWYRDRAGASSGSLTLSFDVHVQLTKP
jgi:hypothetical protein